MRQSVGSEGTSWTDRTLSELTAGRGSTLFGEISYNLVVSEVAAFVEQMTSEESEELWMELDGVIA